jgi:hypothetical protein
MSLVLLIGGLMINSFVRVQRTLGADAVVRLSICQNDELSHVTAGRTWDVLPDHL